jgi:hypothetical protein
MNDGDEWGQQRHRDVTISPAMITHPVPDGERERKTETETENDHRQLTGFDWIFPPPPPQYPCD